MINIEFIHYQLLKNINLLADERVDFEESELDIVFSMHMMRPYVEYSQNPSIDTKANYINTLNKYSILELNNKLCKNKLSIQKNIITDKPSGICTCGGTLNLSDLECIYICTKCYEIREFSGIMTDRVYRPDGGVIILKNNYKHIVYFIQIYKNIFALEKTDFSADLKTRLLKSIYAHIERYKVRIDDIPYSWYRKELKILGYNSLFPHINSLKKEVIGFYPPRLTETEESRCHMYYKYYLELYDAMFKRADKKISYMRCDYVIHQILSQILEQSKRKETILANIYLPQKGTLEKLDINYKKICDSSNGLLKYKPTIRSNT
jgi:hypothetical protein